MASALKRVLVLGGAGFVGRNTVYALLARGASVVVGSRNPAGVAVRLRPAASHIQSVAIRMERLLRANDWGPLLRNTDAVVNCVGILRPSGAASYDRVHHKAPAALACACRDLDLRLVHVSALGLENPVRSSFLISKRHGELAIAESGCDWHLVRPSLLDGERGFGAHWIRRMANWPVHFLAANSRGRVAPLDVRDLGEAIAELALSGGREHALPNDRIIELGGNEVRGFSEHLAAMRTRAGRRPVHVWTVWSFLARAVSHICDGLRLTPYSFGHYELMMRDNLPRRNRLPELLSHRPRQVAGFGESGSARIDEPSSAARAC